MKKLTLGFLSVALMGVLASDAAAQAAGAPTVQSSGAWPGFDALTHYWKLDEASGVRTDSVGSAALAPMNNPSSAVGMDGDAVSLNRTTSPYLIYNGVALPSADHVEFSVSAWVKLERMPGVGEGWFFVSQGAPDWVGYFLLGVVGDGAYTGQARLVVAIGGRGGSSLGGGQMAWIGDTSWHQVVVTHSSDGTGRLYLDGSFRQEAYAGSWDMVFEPDFRIGDVRYAAYPKPPEGLSVDGLIDEVAIWNRTLASTEVVELYNNGAGRFYGQLSPEQRIESLIEHVQALVNSGMLAHGPGNALVVSLRTAHSTLAQGNTKASCNTLEAFANKVQSFMDNGTLTTTDGNDLLRTVNGIIAQLCG